MSSEAGPSTATPINPTTSVKRGRSATDDDDDDERPSKRLKDADQDASGDDDDEHPAAEPAAPTGGPAPDDDDEDVVEATLRASSEPPPVVPKTHSPSLTRPVEQDSTTSLDRSTSPRDGVSSASKVPLVAVEDNDELEIKSLPNSPAPEKKPVSLGTELAEYACPICFTPPTNATLTPCGHICCGSCLFSAIKIAATRNLGQEFSAKCPVCRANIPGWDGRGGGVIGLKPRVVYSF